MARRLRAAETALRERAAAQDLRHRREMLSMICVLGLLGASGIIGGITAAITSGAIILPALAFSSGAALLSTAAGMTLAYGGI